MERSRTNRIQFSGGCGLSAEIEACFGPSHEVVPLADCRLRSQIFPDGVRRIAIPDEGPNGIPLPVRSRIWLDIVPRPIMAAGEMVDLLVKTNVGHYIDFRALDALYMEFGGVDGLQPVPGSRADVFQNEFISILEKRLLMRFVKKCYDNSEDDLNGNLEESDCKRNSSNAASSLHSFKEEMLEMRLTEKLQQFLSHSIAFCSGREQLDRAEDGMSAVRNFQRSMVRFGTKTPFLYPNYGSGELAQAFCRLCAVHGGVYVLRRGVKALVRRVASGSCADETAGSPGDNTKVGVVTTENELISCSHLFLSNNLTHTICTDDNGEAIPGNRTECWRLMAITDGSITSESNLKRIMITVPRGTVGNETSAVRIRQLDSSVMVCPEGYFIIYAETVEEDGGEQDILAAFRTYVNVLQGGNSAEKEHGEASPAIREARDQTTLRKKRKPHMLWGVTYAVKEYPQSKGLDARICGVASLTSEHDTTLVIAEARKCFGQVHPLEKFFAKQELDVGSTGSVDTGRNILNGISNHRDGSEDDDEN